MKDGRLQLRVPARLKRQAQQAARRRHMSLSTMITQFLQQVVEVDAAEQAAGLQEDVEQI